MPGPRGQNPGEYKFSVQTSREFDTLVRWRACFSVKAFNGAIIVWEGGVFQRRKSFLKQHLSRKKETKKNRFPPDLIRFCLYIQVEFVSLNRTKRKKC